MNIDDIMAEVDVHLQDAAEVWLGADGALRITKDATTEVRGFVREHKTALVEVLRKIRPARFRVGRVLGWFSVVPAGGQLRQDYVDVLTSAGVSVLRAVPNATLERESRRRKRRAQAQYRISDPVVRRSEQGQEQGNGKHEPEATQESGERKETREITQLNLLDIPDS